MLAICSPCYNNAVPVSSRHARARSKSSQQAVDPLLQRVHSASLSSSWSSMSTCGHLRISTMGMTLSGHQVVFTWRQNSIAGQGATALQNACQSPAFKRRTSALASWLWAHSHVAACLTRGMVGRHGRQEAESLRLVATPARRPRLQSLEQQSRARRSAPFTDATCQLVLPPNKYTDCMRGASAAGVALFETCLGKHDSRAAGGRGVRHRQARTSTAGTG